MQWCTDIYRCTTAPLHSADGCTCTTSALPLHHCTTALQTDVHVHHQSIPARAADQQVAADGRTCTTTAPLPSDRLARAPLQHPAAGVHMHHHRV